ncbi:energy-coupling factor transporter transmembrane component T [Corynebacterium sp. TAE3-ERU2]|uniref:energy-coupling factor transporter transmembrane component T n=1 Tax=Corynebacterium sp. TAE3-ERU2 TaxID=2849497 RepID=UPI002102560D|nr:energy-coupling factor transporter transmembrane component T [Corynebacterium sp. TAE3-ERU2]
MPGSGARTAGLHLDPRTTVLVILVVSSVLLSPAGSGGVLGSVARWILIAVPGVLFLASGLLAPALRYAITFAALAGIPKLIVLTVAERHIFVDIFATWFGGISLIIPGITCCWYMLRTTSASEFVAAMQRIRCPNALSIPTSIIFRFFPTIAEEYRDIRTAMRMRGISGLRNPVAMLEYRFVPLLVSVVGIGNELAMSAVTRGLGLPRRRTTLCTIGFRAGDIVVIAVLATCLGLLIANRVMVS